MSGCPVGCKFCATGKLKKCRNLTADEIAYQVKYIIEKNPAYNPEESKEFKINYTRMGEPFLNIGNVKAAMYDLDTVYSGIHHYISTMGVAGSDFSFITPNITLQFSIHSFSERHRNWLIPYKNKMTMEEMGKIRTSSNLKTTLNLTLIDDTDFDIVKLQKWFPKDSFFVKLSPINPNETSVMNDVNSGIIKQTNLI